MQGAKRVAPTTGTKKSSIPEGMLLFYFVGPIPGVNQSGFLKAFCLWGVFFLYAMLKSAPRNATLNLNNLDMIGKKEQS